MTYVQIAGAAVAIIATFGAIFLAYMGKDGWGWLIFLAIVAIPTIDKDEPFIDVKIQKTVDSKQQVN